tara:strand:- start:266 stop:442 length:177 start_codon:yes stop_codon:yes gene_type:complete
MKIKKWAGWTMLTLFVTAIFVGTGEVYGYVEAVIVWSLAIFGGTLFHASMYLIYGGED